VNYRFLGAVSLVLFGCGCGSATQTVTIPGGSSSSDVGSQINAAASSLGSGGGAVEIPAQAGCYAFSTPIVLPDGVRLSGDSATTCLQYTATSGTAITIASSDTLAEFKLIGISGASTATGLAVHGDNDVVDHLTIGAFGAKFHLGLTFTDFAYLDRFYATSLTYNDQNLYYPGGLLNAGENIAWFGGTISNGGTFANCVQNGTAGTLSNGELSFYGTSFDECQVVSNESMFKMHGGHFEDGGVTSDHPFLVTYSSNLDAQQGVRAGSLLDGVTVFTDTASSGVALFEVDKYGSLSISGMIDATIDQTPLVRLGNNASDAPYFHFQDAQNARSEAQLYSVFPGTEPVLDISTPKVQQHGSAGNQVFSHTSSVSQYGHDSAVVAAGPDLGMYHWTGVGQNWYGGMLQADAIGGGFNVCGAGSFPFTGYAALGDEAETCATHLGLNSLSTQVVNSATGYQVNGGFGNKGDCLVSVGNGSTWGPCGSGATTTGNGMARSQAVVAGTGDAAAAAEPAPEVRWMPAAICSGGASARGDFSTYATRAPRAGCLAAASSAAAYLAFEAQPATPQFATATFTAPPNWAGTDVLLVFTGTAVTGNVAWTVQSGCTNPDDVLSSVTFSAGAEAMAPVSTTPGGLVRLPKMANIAAPGSNGCAAGSLVTLRITRAGWDTQPGEADLLGVVLTTRTSQ
jgi:hypothetical protein